MPLILVVGHSVDETATMVSSPVGAFLGVPQEVRKVVVASSIIVSFTVLFYLATD